MSDVGFECSIIFFVKVVAACMWQKAIAETVKLKRMNIQIDKIKNIFANVCLINI
jgi:hypothetical protein